MPMHKIDILMDKALNKTSGRYGMLVAPYESRRSGAQ